MGLGLVTEGELSLLRGGGPADRAWKAVLTGLKEEGSWFFRKPDKGQMQTATLLQGIHAQLFPHYPPK